MGFTRSQTRASTKTNKDDKKSSGSSSTTEEPPPADENTTASSTETKKDTKTSAGQDHAKDNKKDKEKDKKDNVIDAKGDDTKSKQPAATTVDDTTMTNEEGAVEGTTTKKSSNKENSTKSSPPTERTKDAKAKSSARETASTRGGDEDVEMKDATTTASPRSTSRATSGLVKAAEDTVALAAMQEAATLMMEAENQKKRKAAAAALEEKHPFTHNNRKRATPTRTSWDDRLQQLADYKKEHGNLLIPIRYKLNPSLGKFVHNTREQFKLFHKKTPPGYKKKCSLTAKRIEQLEELGFAWTTERTKRQNEDWSNRFEQLTAFKEKHGHCMVPHGYTEDPSFAEWIHRQRTTYASMLKEEKPNEAVKNRMQQLRDLGFNFTVHSDKWMYHWEQLKAYKKTNGDCQVPTHYSENPKLGRWVHTQRHQRRLLSKGKKSCMTQERIDMLDQLGFSWEVRPSLERPRATWQQRLEELTEYKTAHEDFKVDPTNMPQLHAWCHEQRLRLQQVDKSDEDVSKKMTKERIEALTQIGFTKDAELLDPLPKPEEDSPKETTGEVKEEASSSEKVGAAVETTGKDSTTSDAAPGAASTPKAESTETNGSNKAEESAKNNKESEVKGEAQEIKQTTAALVAEV